MRTEDGHIIQKCLDGDVAAFGLLVDKYKGSVYALAYAKLGSFHDAQDITQEVFLKAYQKLRTLKQWDKFLSWLYAITSNLCKDFLRSKASRPDGEYVADQEKQRLDKISMCSFQEDEIHQTLQEALSEMPEIHRQVLTLYYLGGMSCREIAQFLGASPHAIAMRLNRARAKLRKEMLAMMNTGFEQQKLNPAFTLNIVEVIQRTRIQSNPQTPAVPIGIAAASLLTLSMLCLIVPFDRVPAVGELVGMPISSETRATEDGEIPVEVVMLSDTSVVSGGDGKKDLMKNSQPTNEVRAANAHEGVLYEEIQAVSNYRPDELLPRPRLLGPDSALEKMEKYGQGWEMALELCEKFLNAYPNSQRHDAVWYDQLNYLFGLQRNVEFDAGAEAFLLKHPFSKYANRLRRLRVYRFMDELKFDQALAELDKIDDPAMLPEVFERKRDVYIELGNDLKATEFYLLWANLVLGKPAPEFSHVSVDGDRVSLQSFRGKVVMLYHWSTRDISTVWEIPTLKRFHKIHRENPDFVLINVCTYGTKAELKQFVEAHAMPGIHLLLEPEAVPYHFGAILLLNYLPHYVILDKTGMIRVTDDALVRGDFNFEHTVTALLAEDTIADSERIIPQLQQAHADYYLVRNQTENSIAEYEKLLAFTPNNLDIMMDIFNLKLFPSADTKLMNRAYYRMLELDLLGRLSPELGLDIGYHILELTELFSERGDQEKTWTLFQVAVAHDSNAINYARRNPINFATIKDMPEFQKLLAETPQTEADR